MRLETDQASFLKRRIRTILPDAEVYLFGSRANDQLRGGDIDILVEGETKLTLQEIREIKIAFYRKFGEQKLDVVAFKRGTASTFRDLVLLDAIRL